jgi:FkbM family methyltransferase
MGTTHFVMPRTIRLRGGTVGLSLPAESLTGLDFINLALDDEYGLATVPIEVRTVLDVGANVGLFSLLAAHYFPAAVIHAYEPNPTTYAYAASNLADPHFTVFPAGLGSHDGRADLHLNDDSRMAQTRIAATGTIRIDSLAQAIERLGGTVDLVKIDCEGAEWDLFQDAESFGRVRLIRMEYHLTDGRTVDDVTAVATRLGFAVDRIEPNQGFGVAWMSRIPV